MSFRVTRSRSRADFSPEIDDAGSSISSHIDADIDQLVTDTANEQATQAKGKGKAVPADKDDELAGLTKADLVDMIHVQKNLFQDIVLALTAKNAAAPHTIELPMRTAAREMIDPTEFCGDAQNLGRRLSQLKHRFNTEAHRFHGEADQVDYALSLLGKWTGDADAKLRKTQMTNPDEWGTSLVTVSSPVFPASSSSRRMYEDKDRQLNAAIKAAEEFLQGYADPNETVGAYANRIRTNWREAGWDEATNVRVLYDLAWAGLRPHIRGRIRLFANDITGRFDTIDQMFDKAASAQSNDPTRTKSRNEPSPNQQRDRKRRFDGNSDNNGGGRNGGNTGGNTGRSWKPTGSQSRLPPAPWVSFEIMNKRKAAGECGRCGNADHKHYNCPKYSQAHFPDHLKVDRNTDNAKGEGQQQLKKQKSFDFDRAKN